MRLYRRQTHIGITSSASLIETHPIPLGRVALSARAERTSDTTDKSFTERPSFQDKESYDRPVTGAYSMTGARCYCVTRSSGFGHRRI